MRDTGNKVKPEQGQVINLATVKDDSIQDIP